MSKKTRLELTWIGKNDAHKLEPRILVEDETLSYHAAVRHSEFDQFQNLLIHADNLLALKALEADFERQIKCVYIDPPFNTQQAFEHYEDGLEHSLWLSLMRDRLQLIHRLLSDDGTLFLHIDDNELAYIIAVADEIFGRSNRISIVTFKQGAATGHKSINPGVVTNSNFVLIYSKDKSKWTPNRIFTARSDRDKRYNQFIENIDDHYSTWRFITLTRAFAQSLDLPERGLKKALGSDFEEKVTDFVHKNAKSVVRLARPDYNAVSAAARTLIDETKSKRNEVKLLERDNLSDMYFFNGERILFYTTKLKLIDGEYIAGEPLTTIWDDLLSNNLHNEGGVKFPKGKKPEALLKRCIELASSPGDIVLDSFAGSGTTGAVAHKMGRRWIMVELGDHATTHIIPRIQSVIDGKDASGITAAANWKGGGGFRFYHLAPSLLTKDRFGNWIISQEYNPAMLAEALCKHLGFTYAPSQDPGEYWRHGHSTETDFIYVTTQSLTYDALKKLSEELGPKRTLLVCCKAFNANEDSFPNLTIKKIPHSILAKCEWGRDDYSLRIADLPLIESEDAMEVTEDDVPYSDHKEPKTALPLFELGGEE
ncbi:site-specific DNA-methyltransferase [uncultured Roseibium sp.]|uniref:site-specific DNA-methyltransferase n=1 Tax=uncultured Roseibium sp. TaxID=1936171 RepID=UPI0026346D8C|nr:site-specific DNA-methyltransferase [uncultured Roseibium sp.]